MPGLNAVHASIHINLTTTYELSAIILSIVKM